VEVGLGGRLDCTNIIRPDLSIITNISFDHTQFLGKTLPLIAAEKAGIIKEGIPVIIGESGEEDVKNVFADKALKTSSKIIFAEEQDEIESVTYNEEAKTIYETRNHGNITAQLGGFCQEKNTATILSAVDELISRGYHISEADLKEGFRHVCDLTGLQGRWQQLGSNPRVICDTGHNVAGFQYTVTQLSRQTYQHLHIIIGMVSDKDVTSILRMLPKDAIYYFTQASVKRAMPAAEFAKKAANEGLKGEVFENVSQAYDAALKEASPEDLIFIGGSNFIVADMLKNTI